MQTPNPTGWKPTYWQDSLGASQATLARRSWHFRPKLAYRQKQNKPASNLTTLQRQAILAERLLAKLTTAREAEAKRSNPL